tara:strand:+ start:3060 stop:4763 length:1704 start_codon:yes stop_codon:yes gene_type:complete
MSVLQKLTEGIVDRDLAKEGAALQSKWEATGLLEGISDDRDRASMSRLLENQAKELLREVSTMAAGDVEGFAAVAFPIVRRVFGGLLANDLVSVQPMSLPSGLIFFLDFQYSSADRNGADQADSLYGGGVVASQLTGGVSDITEDGGGFYNMANAYASPTGSASVTLSAVSGLTATTVSSLTEAQKKLVRFDPDLLANTTSQVAQFTFPAPSDLNRDMIQAIEDGGGLGTDDAIVRRLTSINRTTGVITITVEATDGSVATAAGGSKAFKYPVADTFTDADATGGVKGAASWPLELATDTLAEAGADKDIIPEIDIKVDSIAVTAVTKKLKAKWSPELGQDLNAYHNLDAEVELTSILSEQIALEIDREIVNDLIQGATAGTYYWSRSPGLFVNRTTGEELGATAAAPDFTGTVSEWYETLIETINDVSAQIHRKTLRGGANFLVTSPEVANILEFTSGFRASVTADADRGTVGAVNVGSVSKKFDVYVDPYFPRNVILVGRKGSSFLESGYVYAPYVPLQVTPTIFGVEDFVPRKGVMTRYAKKMVRPDMYGLVVCRGLLGESGAS